jgi:phosphate transport system substrate-binding protein
MKLQRWLCILIWVVGAAAPAFAHHMAVVVNHDTAVQNMSSTQLARIIKGDVKKWSDGKNVLLVLHGSSSGELATLEHLTKMSGADVSALIASHRESIRMVATDADVIDAVSSTPGAIGFVEEHSINDRVSVIKVDGKLPMEAGYLPH